MIDFTAGSNYTDICYNFTEVCDRGSVV